MGWWELYGPTVLWGLGGVTAVVLSMRRFENQLERRLAFIDRRLFRIEIVLGIRRIKQIDDHDIDGEEVKDGFGV